MLRFRDAWQHRPTQQRVWALAAPMMLCNLSVPLVTLIDSAVVGHLPQAQQLAAVAIGGSLYGLLVGIMGFLRMGTSGFSAQACGRGDGALLRQTLLQGLLLALGWALLIGLLSLPFSDLALALMQPSAQLSELTRSYFYIRLLGLPAALANYALVGWLLGCQNARAPLAIMLTTNLLNALLCVLFVLGFSWGIRGAAYAAVVAELSGSLLALYLTRCALRQFPGQINWSALRHWLNWRPLLSLNRDILLRTLALQLVFFLVTVQGTRLGDSTVAANALLLNGLMLSAFALDGLANALEALCGHAIGARDGLALRRTLVVAGGWSLLLSWAFALALLLGGQLFINLQSDIASVRAVAYDYLPYLAALPLLSVGSYLLDGLFIGATRGREMRDAMLLAVALSAPLAWLAKDAGNHGLWLVLLAFMLLRSLILGGFAWRLTRAKAWLKVP
jgi:multidrug resistance protein, MATE family